MTTLDQLRGCHNRPDYRTEVQVQDGWTVDGRRNIGVVPHAMTKDCRYSLHNDHQRCAGCRHKQQLQLT